MKRLLGKVIGTMLSVSMMVSLVPGMAVMAATDDPVNEPLIEDEDPEDDEEDSISAKPIGYNERYEDETYIDFGDEPVWICGYGSMEDATLVQGVYLISLDDVIEIEEEGTEYIAVALLYSVDDESYAEIAIFDFDIDYLEDSFAFVTRSEEIAADHDVDYVFDIAEPVVEVDEEVEYVSALIELLPDPEDVTLDYYEDIYDAYDAYYELDEDQKKEVDPDLVEKLDADMIAITRAFIDFYTELANELLADYGDIISDDAKTGLESNLEYSKKVYDDESSSLFTLEEALDNLYYACKTADKELDDIYEFVEGAEASWKKGGKDPFKVRASQKGLSDDAYDSFIAAGSVVIVDETQLTGDQFTASEGSVIIEIIPEFLETLTVGEHTLTIKFENNVSVTTKFTIEAAADVPASGESVSPAVYVGVAMVLLAGAGFVVNKRLGKKES